MDASTLQTRDERASGGISGLVSAVAAEVRRDLPLHFIVLAYVLAVLFASLVADRPDRFRPFMYAGGWFTALPAALIIGGPIIIFVSGIAQNPTAPLQGVVYSIRCLKFFRLIAGMLLFASVTIFYGAFTSAKNLLPVFFDFSWDIALADFDKAAHFGSDAWIIGFHWLRAYTKIIDYTYGVLWVVAMLLAVLCVAMSERLVSDRRRLFVVFFASWIILGNLLAASFMSGGPIFFDRIVGDAERFAVLTAHLAAYQEPVLSVQTYQAHLWSAHINGSSEFGSGISAFPSLHLAMATWVSIVMSRAYRGMMPFGFLFVVMIQIGSVHLGWHYAIDGYISIAFVLSAWWVTGRVASMRAKV